jgi:hypothetical protein
MKYLVTKFAHKDILHAVDKGIYLGNRKCHVNSLSYARRHPTKVKQIIGCLQVFDDNTGVAHFVVELKDGTILDPTFGNMSSTMYKYVVPLEYYTVAGFSPTRDLVNLKAFLYDQLPWYHKLFIKRGEDL